MKIKTIEKHVARLRSVAANHHGILPSYVWLRDNGHFNSYQLCSKFGLLKEFKRASRKK